MKRTRRKFSSKFKSKVAIEAIQERMTIQQIASKYEVHPNQISQWKRQFLDGAESVFETDTSAKDQQHEHQKEQDKQCTEFLKSSTPIKEVSSPQFCSPTLLKSMK